MDVSALMCLESWNPVFLIFTDQAPKLLYYSHIPTALLALFLSFFVFIRGRSLATGALLFISILFAVWNFVDLVAWTNADSRNIMFFWSMLYLLQALILCCTWYFSRVFLDQQDVSFSQKLFIGVLLAPLIVLLPTDFNLTGFDVASCEAQQGILINYFYFFQFVLLVLIVGYFIKKYRSIQSRTEKNKMIIFSLGVLLFLATFSWGNLVGSLTLQWELEQYGLFGMPVFIGLLTYLIVRYQAFDVRLLSVQALVTALIFLVGSQLFFPMSHTQFTLIGITLIALLVVGRMLVLSVQKEVQRKEELQVISDRLATANQELRRLDNAKSEFISIASHQLRTPLTAIKGFVSLLLEGAYGKIPREVQDTLNKVYLANSRLMQLVENLLNISRIESGRIQYSFAPTQIEDLVTELVEMFSLAAREKGLALSSDFPKEKLPEINLDAAKIREVLSNLIDNALKYTEQGGILIRVVQNQSGVEIVVEDTGMGIDPDDLPHLFKKFERGKQAAHVNVSSTGLGLYVGKNFIEAHGGTITAHSEGVGRGSRFIVSIPFKSKN